MFKEKRKKKPFSLLSWYSYIHHCSKESLWFIYYNYINIYDPVMYTSCIITQALNKNGLFIIFGTNSSYSINFFCSFFFFVIQFFRILLSIPNFIYLFLFFSFFSLFLFLFLLLSGNFDSFGSLNMLYRECIHKWTEEIVKGR